jgi:hypothetical protein
VFSEERSVLQICRGIVCQEETRDGCVEWIHLYQNRDLLLDVVNTALNFRIPQKVRNLLSSCAAVSSSGKSLLHGVVKKVKIKKGKVVPVLN